MALLYKKVSLQDALNNKYDTKGSLVLLLTIPNIILIPSIPFLPLLCGIPVMILLWNIMTKSDIILPSWFNASISQKNFDRCLSFAKKMSFFASTNRCQAWLISSWQMYMVCATGILMTVGICLPLPIINIPVAFSMLFMGMGLSKNDGLMAWIGTIFGIFSLLFIVVMVFWISYDIGLLIE